MNRDFFFIFPKINYPERKSEQKKNVRGIKKKGRMDIKTSAQKNLSAINQSPYLEWEKDKK